MAMVAWQPPTTILPAGPSTITWSRSGRRRSRPSGCATTTAPLDHNKVARAEKAAAHLRQVGPRDATAGTCPATTTRNSSATPIAAYKQEARPGSITPYMIRGRVACPSRSKLAHNNSGWPPRSATSAGQGRNHRRPELVEQPGPPEERAQRRGASPSDRATPMGSRTLIRYEIWDDLDRRHQLRGLTGPTRQSRRRS